MPNAFGDGVRPHGRHAAPKVRAVPTRRPVARPNRGFAEQLIAMDEGRGGEGAGVCLADFDARYA